MCEVSFCHREPFKISALRFTHKLHILNPKFDEEFLNKLNNNKEATRAYSVLGIFSCES